MRLFVAVFPPADVCAHLSARLPAGARLTPVDRWHITLRFVGDTDRPAEVERALCAVPKLGPMELRLAGAGTFGRSVLWAGVEGDLTALAALREAVVEALGRPAEALGGLAEALGGPAAEFTPHLTVTYARTAAAGDALRGYQGPTWTVGEFALVRSLQGSGGGYRILRRWPL